jgi:hypothetical protein
MMPIIIPVFTGGDYGGKIGDAASYYLSAYVLGALVVGLPHLQLPFPAFILLLLIGIFLAYKYIITTIGLIKGKSTTIPLVIGLIWIFYSYSILSVPGTILGSLMSNGDSSIRVLCWLFGLCLCFTSGFIFDFDQD